MDDVQDATSVECTFNRRAQMMRSKNFGLIGTEHYSSKDDEVDKYGHNIIPPLAVLEGSITDVPNIEK